MRDILPAGLLKTLRDHYVAGVADAEALYAQGAADEDSLTGALGQALASRKPIVHTSSMGTFEVHVSYLKLRGRGAGAPESRYGSDGVFQISVERSDGTPIRRKGLPFQAKKNWRHDTGRMLGQARDMESTTPGGVVINYTPDGYRACPARNVVATGAQVESADFLSAVQPLGQLLGSEFLYCRIGTIGLYFDPLKEEYRIAPAEPSMALITTVVRASAG